MLEAEGCGTRCTRCTRWRCSQSCVNPSSPLSPSLLFRHRRRPDGWTHLLLKRLQPLVRLLLCCVARIRVERLQRREDLVHRCDVRMRVGGVGQTSKGARARKGTHAQTALRISSALLCSHHIRAAHRSRARETTLQWLVVSAMGMLCWFTALCSQRGRTSRGVRDIRLIETSDGKQLYVSGSRHPDNNGDRHITMINGYKYTCSASSEPQRPAAARRLPAPPRPDVGT